MIREESARLKGERVTQETITRQGHQVKVKTQREKRKKVKEIPPKITASIKSRQPIESNQQIPIMEITQIAAESPQLVHDIEQIQDTPTEIPAMVYSMDCIQYEIQYPVLTDAYIMHVMESIQCTALEKLLGVKNQTIAELAAMEIATIVTNTLSDFYPSSFQELETMSTQLLMWIDMIINQALTVEVVAELNVCEAEADQVIKTITQLEAEVDLSSEDGFTVNTPLAITLVGLLLTVIRRPNVGKYIPQPPQFHWNCFYWCKRTRLKSWVTHNYT